MPSMRYTSPNDSLRFQPMPGQREIRRRPARDFTLHRPHSDQSCEEVRPLV